MENAPSTLYRCFIDKTEICLFYGESSIHSQQGFIDKTEICFDVRKLLIIGVWRS